ncbi:MAG: hypothetical protein HYU36_17405 [Planctomycetes bacterium]|nr:hypothetical protein [Planctomycetota bacterium]
MSLEELLADGCIRARRTSAREAADLLRVVDGGLADAAVPHLSTDRRFATAYNAALRLAAVALHAPGYRAAGAGHHCATFHVLPEIVGPQARARAGYLDNCRSKRNVTDYDRAGEISERDAEGILAEAKTVRKDCSLAEARLFM